MKELMEFIAEAEELLAKLDADEATIEQVGRDLVGSVNAALPALRKLAGSAAS